MMGSISIRQLVEDDYIKDDILELADVPFECFSRLTSTSSRTRCVFISSDQYISCLDPTVSMVITKPELADRVREHGPYGICVVQEPRGFFFECMRKYDRVCPREKTPTVIGKNCSISKTAIIAAENVCLGDHVTVGDYTVIHENVTIGSGTTMQEFCSIGAQGFNTYRYKGKAHQAIHSGRVEIGENVLISTRSSIDQALYFDGCTYIGNNCSIGTGCAIAHNDRLDDGVELCAGVQLGGFVDIGEDAVLYVGAEVRNGIAIGKRATVGIGGVVIHNVADDSSVFGVPAKQLLVPGGK